MIPQCQHEGLEKGATFCAADLRKPSMSDLCDVTNKQLAELTMS